MSISGIYKITNPNGNLYIGQSINIEGRFRQYRNSGAKGQRILERSFKKYGVEKHIFEVIEYCEICDLNARECYWIDYYNTWLDDNHMNCRSGGSFGKHSEASKELNRQKHLGKKHSPELIEKRIAPLRGKKRNPEIGRKVSATKKGVKFTKEHALNNIKSRMANPNWSEMHRIRGLKIGKKVIDTATGIIYDTARQAAESNGILKDTLIPKLNGAFRNNTTFKYLEQ